MHLPVRRALAAAAATAAVLALAGCGDNDSEKAADKPATSETSASDSATPSDDSATEDSGDTSGETVSGDDFKAVLENALDQATTAKLAMDLGQLGSGTGEADYSQDPPAVGVTLTRAALGGDVEVRVVDGMIYLKGAQFGDGWVSFDSTDPSSPLGDLGAQLDPAQQFETFASAVTEATHVGDDDVDGETLDKYTTTVDSAQLLKDLPQAGAGGASLPDTIEQDWWFDDEGRIRQFSMDLGGGTAIKLALSDWGSDVSVEAPPADEVTPFGQGGA